VKEKVRINAQILAPRLRVIDDVDNNLGVISREEALRLTQEKGLDLIEISPNAEPPIAKIMDYGRFQYTSQKKDRDTRAKAHVTETKTIQIKIGTSERDLFLPGRTKYMEPKFLEERLDRVLRLISEEYKIAEEPKKSPKGLTVVIERSSGKGSAPKPKEATPTPVEAA
jgi:translation initiation factor IF-3